MGSTGAEPGFVAGMGFWQEESVQGIKRTNKAGPAKIRETFRISPKGVRETAETQRNKGLVLRGRRAYRMFGASSALIKNTLDAFGKERWKKPKPNSWSVLTSLQAERPNASKTSPAVLG